MKSPEYYRGREQTYVKHFFLEQYLETVAFHIGYTQREFTYVDCFSGPWRHGDEDLADTSIRISLDKLNYVRQGLAEQQKHPIINAIFIERDPAAFATLQQAVDRHHGSVRATALPGEFETNIPKIVAAINKKFAFIFLDPTGWNVQMDRIAPLLQHQPGEVVINLMYDFINRFLNSTDAPTEASLDRFFGCGEWRALRERPDRETAIVEFYIERVRTVGNFQYVTSTKILKPLHQRAYFHLIYATRNSKGIEKFRDVERRLVAAQDRIRDTAQREHRIEKTGQNELFFGQFESLSSPVEDERAVQRGKAKAKIFEVLQRGPCAYENLLPIVLQTPLFWKTDLNEVLREEQHSGRIVIEGMTSRQRTPKDGCRIRLASATKLQSDN
ncbi:MAG TPA: three-Cys-motif partner protein TcmP [Bryobacteraceae bacterium]|jgi:three-Cys-motif partner protein|nr:three-Cys-motif partner protein TcmP [Bryobacteraceae bacterium]